MAQALPSSGMNWEDHGNLLTYFSQSFEYLLQDREIIDVRRTMERDQNITVRQIGWYAVLSFLQKADQRVDHHVAHQMNSLFCDALTDKILISVRGWSEKHIGNLIGQKAINFFRHGAVEGAQTSFHVSHRDQKLGANQGRSDR